MEREIEFRGKNLKGEWLYGDLVHNRGKVYIAPLKIENLWNLENKMIIQHLVVLE